MRYLGKNEMLHKELRNYGKAVEECYKEIFREHYSKLQEIEEELLVPEAFASSLNEFKKPKNCEISLISDKEHDNFFFNLISSDAYLMEIEEDGKVKLNATALDTSCGIIFNDEGVSNHSNRFYLDRVPKHLISYVHEYNHFSSYALQEKPWICVGNLLISQLSKRMYERDPKNLDEDEDNISKFLRTENMNEKRILMSAIEVFSIDEALTLALEAKILRMMGFDNSRFINSLKNSEFYNLFLAFYGAPETNLLNYITEWHRRVRGDEFLSNLLYSLEGIKIEKVNINTFVSKEEEKKMIKP